MNEPDDNKYENKYLEVVLMLCYFLIPFFGLHMALRDYLDVDDLSWMYLVLLLFIGGNIMVCLIFILNDKKLITKVYWTIGLLALIVIFNLVVN